MISLYHKFLTASLLTTISLSLAACGGKKEADAKGAAGKPQGLIAEAYVVNTQPFQTDITASGSLLPNEEISIMPEISGRIVSLNFKEGTRVRKGQVLVQLYDADLRAQVQKLRAQRQLQVNILKRQQELLNIGGISKQDFEVTQAQIQTIDADIAAVDAQIRRTKIIAPFDGVIGLRNVSNGAIVSMTTVIATLQQTNPLKMDFNVPSQYRDAVVTGKEVFFTITGSTDTMTGKISAIDAGANATTRTVKVRALIPNPDGKLLPGGFANVNIPLESTPNAILIPSQAIIPTTRDKKVAVLRQGKANMVTVVLGVRTADKVEIVQGLQQGDTIITTGLMQLKPGMPVKVGKLRS